MAEAQRSAPGELHRIKSRVLSTLFNITEQGKGVDGLSCICLYSCEKKSLLSSLTHVAMERVSPSLERAVITKGKPAADPRNTGQPMS